MNKFLTIALLGLALPVVAQSKPTPSTKPAVVDTKPVPAADVKPEVAPELTQTEKLALASVYKQYQETLSVLSQINIDTAKVHPGYHLDPNNPFSGRLVKDAVPEKAPEKK